MPDSRSIKTEIVAGVTSFLATMYILVVNPIILSASGMPFNAVLTATVLVSAFSSIAMGLYAKNPIIVAPGMGLNAFFTYSIVLTKGVAWETALGAVFISGIIFIVLSVFNIRTLIVRAIPKQLRYAIASGIGLFIALIGFSNSGFIITGDSTILSRGTLAAPVLLFLAGLTITSVLLLKKIRGAFILGIIITTILSIPLGRIWGDMEIVSWQGIYAAPDFSLIFKLDILTAMQFAFVPVIFAFLFTDMFDSLSTFIGIAEAGNLLDEQGEPKNIKQALIVDGFSTLISGLLGSSPGTSYIESASGIREGGRTGMTAVVGGLLFLPFMFFSPLLSTIPAIAVAPVLILVGVFMASPISKINWTRLDDAIPSFLALFLIPLTYSITQGIIWGFLSFTVLKFFAGKREKITPMLLIIDVLAIGALFV